MSKIFFACSLDKFWFQVDIELWKTGAPEGGDDFYPGIENKSWERLRPKAVELLKPILEILPSSDGFARIQVGKDCFRVVTGKECQAALFPKVMRHVCKVANTREVVVANLWMSLELHKRALDYVASGW